MTEEINENLSFINGQVYGRVAWVTQTELGIYIWSGFKQIRAVLIGPPVLRLILSGITKGEIVLAAGDFSTRSSTSRTTGELIIDLLCYAYRAHIDKAPTAANFKGSVMGTAKCGVKSWFQHNNVMKGSFFDRRANYSVELCIFTKKYVESMENDQKREEFNSRIKPHRHVVACGCVEPGAYFNRSGVLTQTLTLFPSKFQLQA